MPYLGRFQVLHFLWVGDHVKRINNNRETIAHFGDKVRHGVEFINLAPLFYVRNQAGVMPQNHFFQGVVLDQTGSSGLFDFFVNGLVHRASGITGGHINKETNTVGDVGIQFDQPVDAFDHVFTHLCGTFLKQGILGEVFFQVEQYFSLRFPVIPVIFPFFKPKRDRNSQNNGDDF